MRKTQKAKRIEGLLRPQKLAMHYPPIVLLYLLYMYRYSTVVVVHCTVRRRKLQFISNRSRKNEDGRKQFNGKNMKKVSVAFAFYFLRRFSNIAFYECKNCCSCCYCCCCCDLFQIRTFLYSCTDGVFSSNLKQCEKDEEKTCKKSLSERLRLLSHSVRVC